MRRRVLQATIAAVSVAVILLGIPLAIYGAQLVRDGELRELDARAAALSRSVEKAIVNHDPLNEEVLAPYVGGDDNISASVYVVGPNGEQLRACSAIEGRSYSASRRTESNAVVLLTISWWDVFWRQLQTVALVVGLAVLAFAAGTALAIWGARRLAAPLVYLAASAEQLGSGQVRPRLQPSGVEEIDLVAAELARSSDRMAGRLAAERQFA